MTKKEETRLKKALLEELRKTSNIRLACERSGVPTPLFYTWRRDDYDFSELADRNLEITRDFQSDLAEEKLFELADEGNLSAIKFILEHNSSRYRKRKPAEPEPETDPNKMTIFDLIRSAGDND